MFRQLPAVLLVSDVFEPLDERDMLEVARLLEQPGMVFSMEVLFIPELAPLRQHPDFLPLLERLGVVAYWNAVGCTWEDDRVNCAT